MFHHASMASTSGSSEAGNVKRKCLTAEVVCQEVKFIAKGHQMLAGG